MISGLDKKERKRLLQVEATRRWRERHPEKNIASQVRANLKKPKLKKERIKKFIGSKFNRLTVVEHLGVINNYKVNHWKCVCECGKETVATTTKLKRGLKKSCGCIWIESIRIAGLKRRIPKTKEQQREYWRLRSARRFKKDKITPYLRHRIWEALTQQGVKKRTPLKELIGCSVEDLKSHIKSKWEPWMNWENYGFYGWHIDHIAPCSSFDLSIVENQKKCFHYTNLQPLWWRDNIIKGDKI